jgi:quercetin dioxygenase-like cupin family protein
MRKNNIWGTPTPPLEKHTDARGEIVDIFYKQNIQHVAVIKSTQGAVRGNHYHKSTTQHMLITQGSLEYWFKPLDTSEKSQCILLEKGDFITTPPNEVHALNIIEDNEFVVFTEGIRGGKDYEEDTFRIEGNIINE